MKRLKWILSGGLCRGILLRPTVVVPWFILFFEFPSLVLSQNFWTEIPAPATSYTYSSSNRIVITPDDEIYIVADDGIHKSTDGGETWEFLIDGDEPLYVSETGEIYVGVGSGPTVESFVVKSSDGGQTWDSLPVPWEPGIYSLLETRDNQILLGLRNADAVLRSDDGGLSFSLVFGDSTYSFSDWNSLLQDSGGRIYAMQDYRTEVYTSVDNGDSWDTLPMPEGTERLAGYYASRSGKVFYSTETGSVLTPNDAGTALIEHARVDSALGIYGNVVCARDDGLLLVSNAYDIAASYDNGLTWSLMDMSGTDTSSGRPDILEMEVDSKGYVYFYGSRELYKSAEAVGTVSLGDPNRHLRTGGSLLKVFQNHFEGKTRIYFPLSKRGFLKILGMGGKTFASYDISNRTGIVWEGKDRGGRLLPAGAYIIEANLDGKFSATRLMLSR